MGKKHTQTRTGGDLDLSHLDEELEGGVLILRGAHPVDLVCGQWSDAANPSE